MKQVVFRVFLLFTVFAAVNLSANSQILYNKISTFGGVYYDAVADSNHTYTATKNGLMVFDTSDVSDPKLVTKMDTDKELTNIDIKDDYIFISDEDKSLKMINKSDPASLSVYASINTSGKIEDFTVDGGYLYIAISEYGVEIVDMTDMNVISVSSVVDTNGTASAVAASGDYVYVIDKFKGMQIVNTTSKINPALAGFYSYTSPVSNLAVGGNYVYFADGYNGVEVVDVTDKNAPVHYNKIDLGSYVYDVKVEGNYLYASCGTGGVKIVNISDPSSPYSTGSIDTDGSSRGLFVNGSYIHLADYDGGLKIIDIGSSGSIYGPLLSGEYNEGAAIRSVMIDGNYLYITDKKLGFTALDVSNPNSIKKLGSYNTDGSAEDAFVDGSYAYIADGDKGLVVLDISDKSNPTLKGKVDFGDAVAYAVKEKNGMAYVAAGESGVQIVDVSVPTYPTIKSVYDTEGTARDIFISGNYAYIADGMSGVKIIDISNASYPLVGSVDTDGYAMGIVVVGDYAYVADGGSGLEVIDIKDPANPVVIGNNDTDANSYKKISISGNNVFAADDSDGVDVLDISDPMHPLYLGTYPSKNTTYDTAVSGSTVYIANSTQGLQVVTMTVMPASPTNLKLSVKDSRTIELTWSDNSNNETGFKIFRNGTLITTTAANVTTFTDTGLIPGVTYTYEVKSTNNIGDSLPATATATTEGEPPAAPTNFNAVSVGSKSIKLTWSDNSNNETGFKIYRDSVLIYTAGANSTSYTDTGLTKGKKYSYELRSTNSKGDSDPVAAEAIPVDPKIELYVNRLYEKILNRTNPDLDGKKYWTEILQNGATATFVAKNFFNSAEFVEANLSDTEFVTRAYQTLLNRDPEPEGLVYWLRQMQVSGLLRNQIFYGMALSQEFTDLCQQSYGIEAYDAADLREAFVDRFYNLVLERLSDKGGVKYWTGELKSKRKTAADIANGFFSSDEFVAKAVSNEDFIKIAYRTLLGREADTNGKNFWVGKLNNGYARSAVILDFVYTPEFESLAKKYDIKAHGN